MGEPRASARGPRFTRGFKQERPGAFSLRFATIASRGSRIPASEHSDQACAVFYTSCLTTATSERLGGA